MKKVVLFFAVSAAFAFVSCDGANTNTNPVDSTVVAETIDSAAAVVDSAAAAVVDSAVAVVDSADAAAIQAVQELGANQE